ncbi:MAG: peptidoglycan editing factor PgeF [Lachnospirales bacterium]
MVRKIKNGIVYYTFENFNEKNIEHGFISRIGGCSKDEFASMNLSYSMGDKRENVDENYRKLQETFNIDKYIKGSQTHSKNVVVATDDNYHIFHKTTDGFVTKEDITLFTFHADCGSVFIYDIEKNVCAMLHSGWRGTVLNITKEAINLLVEKFGSNTKDIIVGIGPSICGNCFEIDLDVASKFEELGYNCSFDNVKDKYFIDTKEVIKKQCIEMGVLEKNIEVSKDCTMCNKEDFYSHRRDNVNRGGHLAFIKRK